MKKTLSLLSIFTLACFSRLSAQSVEQTAWKAFFADPINDTITFHIGKDASFVTGSKGDTLVLSKLHISGDTITISDTGGTFPCPNDGVYLTKIEGDKLHLTLVQDECEGRTAITKMEWIKVPD